MSKIADLAERSSRGRRPDGRCYAHISNYINSVGYGNIRPGRFWNTIPSAYLPYARHFADYANGHLKELGLTKLNVNPYKAPRGAILVVRAGTPGTRHPVAGDIAICGGNGEFYNGGMMSYGGSKTFYEGNNYVLGIFVPATYRTTPPIAYSAASCAICLDCLRKPENARNSRACTACKTCSKNCYDCSSNQGGTACVPRCGGATSSSVAASSTPPIVYNTASCTTCLDCLRKPENAKNSRACTSCKTCSKNCYDCSSNQGGTACIPRCGGGGATSSIASPSTPPPPPPPPPSPPTVDPTAACNTCKACLLNPDNLYDSALCAPQCLSCNKQCHDCARWHGGAACASRCESSSSSTTSSSSSSSETVDTTTTATTNEEKK